MSRQIWSIKTLFGNSLSFCLYLLLGTVSVPGIKGLCLWQGLSGLSDCAAPSGDYYLVTLKFHTPTSQMLTQNYYLVMHKFLIGASDPFWLPWVLEAVLGYPTGDTKFLMDSLSITYCWTTVSFRASLEASRKYYLVVWTSCEVLNSLPQFVGGQTWRAQWFNQICWVKNQLN